MVASQKVALKPIPFEPWSMQRKVLRSRNKTHLVCCAGRQSGKTHAFVRLCIRLASERPGSTSVLLMPTYKSTKGTLKHFGEALKALSEQGRRWRWREVEKCFRLWNGSEIYVRTGDQSKEGVPTRGLTIDGMLMIDEAAYLDEAVIDAARLAQAACPDPRIVLLSTPAGRNFFRDEFYSCWPPTKHREAFRFRSIDSPYCNAEYIEQLTERIGRDRAMQELRAFFIGEALAAFREEDLRACFAPEVEMRGDSFALGVDLGQKQDYTVCILVNNFLDAWVLGRFQGSWPEQMRRIVGFANQHGAQVVIDGHSGGGYGGAVGDFLSEQIGAKRVTAYRMGNQGKTRLIEGLKADIEGQRLRIQSGGLGDLLASELAAFEARRRIRNGAEVWDYRGPESGRKGRTKRRDGAEDNTTHDDCVIALALGAYGAKRAKPRKRTITTYKQPARGVGGGGYTF